MSLSRFQYLALVVSLLFVIAMLPACTPKYHPTDEPADGAPTPSSAPPTEELGSGDGEQVEEIAEPWGAEPAIEEEGLQVTAVQARATEFNEQQVLGDIFFPFDRKDLTEESRGRLTAHGRWLRAHPEFGLFIEGHCDERDTDEYNLALGDRRANAARDYLILLGVEAARLQTISYGEERPVDPGHNEAAWSKNRRGHFVVQVLEGMGNTHLGG